VSVRRLGAAPPAFRIASISSSWGVGFCGSTVLRTAARRRPSGDDFGAAPGDVVSRDAARGTDGGGSDAAVSAAAAASGGDLD